MRYVATVLVALMLVFAGCNTGGSGTPTPTATATNQSVDASAVPGANATHLRNPSAVVSATSQALSRPVELNVSIDAPAISEQFHYLGDGEQQLYEISDAQGVTKTYYVDGDSAAVRNATTGEVRYGNGTSAIAARANRNLAVAATAINPLQYLEWEATGTTTVDGTTHYVFEADSINATALDDPALTISPENVTTASGRLVVGTDGIAHEGRVSIETDETRAVEFTLDTRTDVEMTAPSWYDESQASRD